METITWSDFEKVELRAGTILGIKQSSAQITKHYTKEELSGKQILGVVNFPKKQIATFMSEFLVTGLADENGDIVLTAIDKPVPNGSKLI
jgi:tRNA-binding protein